MGSIDYPFQVYPPDVTPLYLHTFDPLGTLIGFVARHHPFSSNIYAPPKASTIAQTVSRTPQSGIIATGPADKLASLVIEDKKKRIGVMTSGGDAPGMNAVVRAVARMAMAKGCEPYAIREGYEGLVQGGDLIEKISWEDIRGYLSEVALPKCPVNMIGRNSYWHSSMCRISGTTRSSSCSSTSH